MCPCSFPDLSASKSHYFTYYYNKEKFLSSIESSSPSQRALWSPSLLLQVSGHIPQLNTDLPTLCEMASSRQRWHLYHLSTYVQQYQVGSLARQRTSMCTGTVCVNRRPTSWFFLYPGHPSQNFAFLCHSCLFHLLPFYICHRVIHVSENILMNWKHWLMWAPWCTRYHFRIVGATEIATISWIPLLFKSIFHMNLKRLDMVF